MGSSSKVESPSYTIKSTVISLLTPRNDSEDVGNAGSGKKSCRRKSCHCQFGQLNVSHVVLTMVISIAMTVPALFVEDIVTMFIVMGCTITPIFGYLLPTYFVLWFVPFKQHRGMIVSAVVMCMIITVVSVLAIYQQICGVIDIGDGI